MKGFCQIKFVSYLLCVCFLIGCGNPKSKTFIFDYSAYSSLNSTILGMVTNRGEISLNKLSQQDKAKADKLGISRIFVSKASGGIVIDYTIYTSGIATSGTCESVVYSENPLQPIVENLAKARANGDSRILIYEKLRDYWFLESLQN